MSHPTASRRISILREEVARKIAAGEVIDRPLSVVRELLDNSLDAGARSVDVHLEAGGIGRVRVVDDGAGMVEEDLALCWQPHATSKIEREDDLLAITSLGFRGEALSSMAVASRLEITSSVGGGAPGHRLVVRGGLQERLEPCEARPGTVAEVSELFFNYPARRRFLRSTSAEAALCRGVFVDRAIAFPDVAFRLYMDGTLRLTLPAASRVERIALCYDLDPRLLGEAAGKGVGCAVEVVAALPEARRRDRRLLQCFVNRRRVQEFPLLQALEYGYQGLVPGGWHPVAFAFLSINPELVDCNIHPTKKEVRLRNLPEAHRAVVEAVQSFLGRRTAAAPASESASARGAPPLSLGRQAPTDAPQETAAPLSPLAADAGAVGERYLGQLYGVFLAFELPDRMVLLDQHAAHERIIYEEIVHHAPRTQELLFPVSFDVSEDEDRWLAGRIADLASVGIVARRVGRGAWEIGGLDPLLGPLGQGAIVEVVREALGDERRWRERLLATMACRLAIKEGDPVDGPAALRLLRAARRLPEPRCPHGRPIWHEIERERLFRLVDRTP